MPNYLHVLKRAFSREFIVVAVLLAAGVLGLGLLTSGWEKLFEKKEVPLRKSLETIPNEFGPYTLVKELKLSEREEGALNSRDYLSWLFRDTRKGSSSPGSGIRLHVVYYTGNQEPVAAAHVPEICYVGGGYKRVDVKQDDLELTSPVPWGLGAEDAVVSIPVREFIYRMPDNPENGSVFYFFVYNGDFIASRKGVALNFLDRSERYVYYCKVEVNPGALQSGSSGEQYFRPGTYSSSETQRMTAEFLTQFLPHLRECMPLQPNLNQED